MKLSITKLGILLSYIGVLLLGFSYRSCIRNAYSEWEQSGDIDPPVLPCFDHMVLAGLFSFIIPLILIIFSYWEIQYHADRILVWITTPLIIIFHFLVSVILGSGALILYHLPGIISIAISLFASFRSLLPIKKSK